MLEQTNDEPLVFNIWREGDSYRLSDGENEMTLATEAEATKVAVAVAQQVGALYRLEYWKP